MSHLEIGIWLYSKTAHSKNPEFINEFNLARASKIDPFLIGSCTATATTLVINFSFSVAISAMLSLTANLFIKTLQTTNKTEKTEIPKKRSVLIRKWLFLGKVFQSRRIASLEFFWFYFLISYLKSWYTPSRR